MRAPFTAADFDRPFGCPPDAPAPHVPIVTVIDLPAPLSVNKLRRVDWKSSKKRQAWERNADSMVLAAKVRTVNPLRLTKIERFELHVVLSQAHTGIDLDNGLKWLIDFLRRIELIKDDGPENLRRLVVEWGFAPEGCRITLTEILP